MSPLRPVIFIFVAVAALILGVLFAFPLPFREYARLEINGAAILAEVSIDPESRMRGLGGRKTLAENAGMLFLFEKPDYYGFWMKGMEFPIDIFWIRNGRIADLEEGAMPRPGVSEILLPVYRPDTSADMVLETNAGFARRYGIRIGDRVSMTLRGKPLVSPSQKANLYDMPLVAEELPLSEPGAPYFIEMLRKESPSGKDFKIQKELVKTDAYRTYSVSYQSGDLSISGVMNIPLGVPPLGGFSVLILNHGLIHPSVYYSGRGSRREQDFFARHGYATIHPDYRGHADSSPNPEKRHDFYVGYSRDAAALVDALRGFTPDLLDADRIGMWGHSMGGGIAARVMVLRPEVRAYVLFAPISADAEDNFYELSSQEISWLAETYGMGEIASRIYKKISPLTYFDFVSAPVQLHHGTGDKDVPIRFSEKMYEELSRLGKKAEFYSYAEEPHEFADAWPLAAERSLQFFDKYVKHTR